VCPLARQRTLIELGQQFGNGIYTLDAIVIRVAVSLLRSDTDIALNVRGRSTLTGSVRIGA
jgi:hypothetical protein